MLFRYALIAAAGLSVIAPARADQPYLDDRSDAASLVESLYNAINRREYARAWTYFSAPPAKSFEDYVKGYADTERVQFRLGAVSEEGAAGSVFYSVPVALQATAKGADQYFAGCFTIRAVNAQVQEPPFRPLQIEKGKFKSVSGDNLDAMVPASCEGAPAVAEADALRAEFKRLLGRALMQECSRAEEALADDQAIGLDRLEWRYSYQTPEEPPQSAYLFTVLCDSGAYNTIENYYLWQQATGFRRLSFAMPDFDIKYEDDNSEKLKSIALTGFSAESGLVNSGYDDKTRSISMFSKWRGLGDASSTGTWVFRDGRFILDVFDVDPTFDGETEAIAVMRQGRLLPLP